MTSWTKENRPRWDADKDGLFTDADLAAVGFGERPAVGDAIADEWWVVRVADDGGVAGYGWLDSEWGDAQIGRALQMLEAAGELENTVVIVTSDHGIAFPGAKTTVYEPGLRVPFIVRDPYTAARGRQSEAMISHVDITPSLLDYAGGLDRAANSPAALVKNPPARRARGKDAEMENPRTGSGRRVLVSGRT